ncbi:MAG: YiiD C-terminal domain-containing protein [Methylotenera sp.]|nr:YiiD C-terminal domain-containing protein [Oligoflexia bacterium]
MYLSPGVELFLKRLMIRHVKLWPPFLGAGIHVVRLSRDFRSLEVRMKLRFWNRNYVGTHFGGSLYSMTDPFYMILLMENLGRDVVVWDKSAQIRYRAPGRGRVHAHFELTQERIDEIRAGLAEHGKVEPVFQIRILDADETLIAEVDRTIHIHLKKKKMQ